MKKFLPLIAIMMMNEVQAQQPPVSEKNPYEISWHGDTRIDNYYWLNDKNNPKVIDYLNKENTYARAKLKHTETFQENLFTEMVARIKQYDESVPYFKNGYWYYTRFEKGFEYPLYCRKKGTLEAKEEIMLNGNEMGKGYKYFAIAGVDVSPDNKMVAYGVDTVSRRNYTLYFKNLITGEIIADKIDQTSGNMEWTNDNKTIFYTWKNPKTLRAEKVFKHTVGTDAAADKEIYFERDETFNLGLGKTKSDQYIIISSTQTVSSEYRILNADTPDGTFTVFQPRQRDLLYGIEHYKDKFYVRTNMDALNFRLMETPLTKTSKENWKEVIAHRKDVLLSGMSVFNDFLVISERSNALTHLRVIDQSTKKEHYIDFPEQAYVAAISINPEFNSKKLRFTYTSMTTPPSTFDYEMATKKKELLKVQEVLGGYKQEDYVTERIWATAKDGTKIPVSIVYKKGFKKDGNSPLLLYGYGSYGSSTDPSFSSVRLSLLDRGFAYAIAHVRGGQEMGRPWYEDGKMFKKMNTFTDFIDCADFLIQNKYTGKEHLYAMGGSAGGLLMGTIINLRPDLWKGIVASVPFVDVVTTMLDETIPLTTFEFDEWGNPKNKDAYFYMKNYSPYDNVENKAYPNMLVTTGLHDSQVQYFEPAKWVAKLREMKTDNNLLLFDCNMDAGHGGASGRFRRLKETAMQYAFILDLEGVKK